MTAPGERPSPRPRPAPVPADVSDPDDQVVQPDPTPAPARPTRSARRRHEAAQQRPFRLAHRAVQVLAALCVAAGITGFVVTRATQPASAHRAHRHAVAPAAAYDPHATLSDQGAAQAFVGAAVSEVVTVSESDYRSLDDALDTGLAVTTGAFRERYRDALTGANAAARKADHDTTSLAVEQAGIGRISDGGRTAKVLVFAAVHQTGDDVPGGMQDVASTLCLTVVRRGDQYLISDLVRGANAGLPPGSTGLPAAAEAARAEVVDTLSYRRADFADDLARAQAGSTGTLREQLTSGAARTLAELRAGGYDLTGQVSAIAVQQADGTTATMLVAATGTSTDGSGAGVVRVDGRYLVNVTLVEDRWLASSIIPVG